jgi:hypothetical protein
MTLGLDCFLDRLDGISTYFERYRERRGGGLQCDQHYRVTHYGKLAYLLPVNGFLFEHTQAERYLRRGLHVLGCLQDQLRRVGDQYIFYPGLLNKYNASNNAIDSGSIADSLCYWHDHFALHTRSEQVAFIRDACSKVAETYLPTTLGKLTNQALWAMTGLAAVYRSIDARPEYRDTCIRCVEQSFRDQNEDGSFPYLPHRLAGEDSQSLHDVSSYYQSRHLSFIFDVADKVGHTFTGSEIDRLVRAADFLCALYAPDGTKSIEVEAKHWYWKGDGTYEWASACFDYHALSECVRRWRRPHHFRVLVQAARSFLDHADAGGAVRRRQGDLDFQCQQFWSAHSAWVVKALASYVPDPAAEAPAEPFRYEGEQSGVVCIRREHVGLQLRTKRYPLTPLFGSYSSSLTYLALCRDGQWSGNLVARRRWSFNAPGEVFQIPVMSALGGWIRNGLRQLWRNRREYRFAVALGFQDLLVGRFRRTAAVLWSVLVTQNLFLLGPVQGTLWGLDNRWQFDGATLTLAGQLARADGERLHGASCSRVMTLRDDAVEGEMHIQNGPAASVFFVPVHAWMVDVLVDTPGATRCLKSGYLFYLRANAAASVRFTLRESARGADRPAIR